ncbi:MAG: CheB methylesterase domain-containing protein [Oscillospiraceae bacterium]
MTNIIKTLIVSNSILFKKSLKQYSPINKNIEIICISYNDLYDFKKTQLINPDIIVLDINIAQVDSFNFFKNFVLKFDIPIIIISSSNANAKKFLDYGAKAFLINPIIDKCLDFSSFTNLLYDEINRVYMQSRSDKIKNILNPENIPIIAIGASTGGTDAILHILKDLPYNSPGIVIVQHMPEIFTSMYAERINELCEITVKEAKHLDKIKKGTALISPGNKQMYVTKVNDVLCVNISPGPKVSGHCPSVDVLFDSLAKLNCKNVMGIILTGMGSDGAKGLLKLKNKGHYTIGQDKESCIVYGMPMEAKKINAICKNVHLSNISNEILNFAKKTSDI